MTVSTADISVLNTLQRLYTLSTSRVKVQKNFGPNHAVRAKHNITLSRYDCVGTLRDLYKDSLTRDNSLRFQVKAAITLPSKSDALTRSTLLKRTELYPTMHPLLPFR